MVKTLKDIPDDRVRAYIVWLPIFGGDFKGASQERSKSFSDERVNYFLDPDSLTGELWKPVLKLNDDIAWDVYLLYGPDAKWDKEPPQPNFWMHQLSGVTQAPRLNQMAFEAKLKEMLPTAKEQNTTKPNSNTQTKTKAKKMRIEFLYFKSCPSHKQALDNLKAALRESHTNADLVLINVDSEQKAQKVGFQGSPSIRINGKDLEGRNEGSNYSCRLYRINGKPTTVPSKEFIMEKLAADN
ncbi:MAG TPA: hypothetical protein VJ464_23650 [Blastocatellia bacterium]|nr:hypothetical protein [Blastocatellia bacterium]